MSTEPILNSHENLKLVSEIGIGIEQYTVRH